MVLDAPKVAPFFIKPPILRLHRQRSACATKYIEQTHLLELGIFPFSVFRAIDDESDALVIQAVEDNVHRRPGSAPTRKLSAHQHTAGDCEYCRANRFAPPYRDRKMILAKDLDPNNLLAF